MKRSLLFVLLVFAVNIAFAQLQVKEGSFKKVDGFVNINIDKMYDDNDKPYAILKIKTENINDKQRRELSFGGDAQTFFETEYKDGEVWLYISYYASFLKISHPDLSSTEFWFPYDMEPKRGYELTLINKPSVDEELVNRIERLENLTTEIAGNPDDYGYLVVRTGSLEGATVYIDGKEMEMKTPFMSDPIKQGPHKIKIAKEGYETYQDIVAVDNKGMKTVDVDLKKIKTTNPNRHKGFVFIPEMNVARSDHSDLHFAFMPQFNLEYMLNPKIGLGIGSGFIYSISSGDIDPAGSIPIYGQLTYYIGNRKTSPFINLKVGYMIGVFDADTKDYYICKHRLTGLHGSATIGVNISRSRIGVSVGSYHYEYSYQYYETSTPGFYTGDRLFFGLSYSYLIPFGKK